jgi:hypothetical protein
MSARYDGIAMSGPADGGSSNGASSTLHQSHDKCVSNGARCSALRAAMSIMLIEVLMHAIKPAITED